MTVGGLAERDALAVDALARDVALPLITGGEVRPARPIGARRAEVVAAQWPPSAGASLERLAEARARAARRLLPLDAPLELLADEWLLLVALNDLLQVEHHDLEGFGESRRRRRVANSALQCVVRAKLPRTFGDLVRRHTLFGRVMAVQRTDVRVTWWVGERTFRGAEPPGRLLVLRRLRSVRTSRATVQLGDLGSGTEIDDVCEAALSRLLGASPLTALLECERPRPKFDVARAARYFGGASARRLALRAADRAGVTSAVERALEGMAGRQRVG